MCSYLASGICAMCCARTSSITTAPGHISRWAKTHRSRGLSRRSVAFFRCRSSADCTIVTSGSDFRQRQVTELLMIVADEDDGRLPVEARASLASVAAQLNALQMLIGSLEKQIKMQHRANPASQRLETIPGIGIIGATAIAATVADPTVFRSGRDFAAWI